MKCPNCERLMRRRVYSLSRRPDALRKSDQRAPLEQAWHCQCGMWVYDPQDSAPRKSVSRSANRSKNPAAPRRFTLLDWPK
ncbi:MAG: hypothetical protein ABIF77_13410 [bacterium]